ASGLFCQSNCDFGNSSVHRRDRKDFVVSSVERSQRLLKNRQRNYAVFFLVAGSILQIESNILNRAMGFK
ncbi:MAG: hypothetical protein NUV74_18290, partial [Candidatus Brocadiaceae bacterium]|nr:hypothetical protein [Candidatus Brocadiaceae bacterium]